MFLKATTLSLKFNFCCRKTKSHRGERSLSRLSSLLLATFWGARPQEALARGRAESDGCKAKLRESRGDAQTQGEPRKAFPFVGGSALCTAMAMRPKVSPASGRGSQKANGMLR